MINFRVIIILMYIMGIIVTMLFQVFGIFEYNSIPLQMATYISIFSYIIVLIYFYIKRKDNFSLGLITALIFTLFLGGPAVYLLISKDLVVNFQIVLILVIQINTIIFFFSDPVFFDKNSFVLTKVFYLLYMVVFLCQIYKISIYLIFILNSGLGHLAIYISGDDLRGSVPFIIRGFSGLSIIMSMMTFFFPSSKRIKIISILILMSDLFIGIRGKFFFSMVSILFLYSYTNRKKAVEIFTILTGIIPIGVLFIALSFISYFREGYTIDFYSYLFIVLDSISSTVAGLERLFIISDDWWSKYFSYSMVIDQVIPLLGFYNSEETGIARIYSLLVLRDISNGIGLSSSIVLEAIVVMGELFPILLLAYLIFFIFIIPFFLKKDYIAINILGLSFVSGFLFSARAEMVLPIVYVMKFLPVIVISPFLVYKKEKLT